jgi:hypothetical protein
VYSLPLSFIVAEFGCDAGDEDTVILIREVALATIDLEVDHPPVGVNIVKCSPSAVGESTLERRVQAHVCQCSFEVVMAIKVTYH